MWRALLGDLSARIPAALVAARFHVAVADAIVVMVERARRTDAFEDTVILSGGVWQNRVLFERVVDMLTSRELTVLTHTAVPAHDGCIALGQAAIAAASTLD